MSKLERYIFKSLGINPDSDNKYLKLVEYDMANLCFINNPSEKIKLAEKEKLQLKIVKQRGFAIQYIENPSEKVQLAAVKREGWSIQFIENPSEKIKLAAVKNNPDTIGYINNPTEQMQLEAVKKMH